MHKKRMKNQNGQMPFTMRMLVLLMVQKRYCLPKTRKQITAGIIDLFDTVFVETNKFNCQQH
jgi:hypothetical protein